MSDIKQPQFWIGLLKKIIVIMLKPLQKSSSHHQHVVPYEGSWAVRGEGNSKITAVYDTQAEALIRAREIAINYKADVIIHRSDGTIRDRQTYR